jgi:signal transduction histidine kinase
MSIGSLTAEWMTRLVSSRAHVRTRPRARWATVCACVVVLAGTGAADWFTGRDLSLAVAYLLPVLVVTVLIGRAAGLLLSLLSLGLWVAADTLAAGANHRAVASVNDLLRFAIFLLVVLLLAALHDSVLSTREANERGRQFLAYAAHQLRTPLAGMSSAGQALLFDPPPAEREQLLAVISRETARAGRLVSGLLRIARLDQGEPVQWDETSVRELLVEATDRWHARWPQLDLSIELSAEVPARARLPQDAAREILDNLLDNACRHAEAHVRLTVSATRERLEVRVTDDGPGLPPGTEERAFERFVSLDGRGGSGLGLAIARQLAQTNFGDVSYGDHGFVLSLPWRPGTHGANVTVGDGLEQVALKDPENHPRIANSK